MESAHQLSQLVLAQMVDEARREIEGRLQYWREKAAGHTKDCVVANLEWALMRLDDAPGHIRALTARAESRG